jgi:hypothetical protein
MYKLNNFNKNCNYSDGVSARFGREIAKLKYDLLIQRGLYFPETVDVVIVVVRIRRKSGASNRAARKR